MYPWIADADLETRTIERNMAVRYANVLPPFTGRGQMSPRPASYTPPNGVRSSARVLNKALIYPLVLLRRPLRYRSISYKLFRARPILLPENAFLYENPRRPGRITPWACCPQKSLGCIYRTCCEYTDSSDQHYFFNINYRN